MTQPLVYDVAIIGAGPTGLTLANILGRAGLRVVLLERHESTVRAPRAVSIDDESLRTMQAIGLVDEVLRNVATDYGSYYFSADGRRFATVEPKTREYGFPRRNAFTQPELERTLLEGVRRFTNVSVFFCHLVESLHEGASEVSLQVSSEDAGMLSIQAAYVVGCDGAKSFCRKHIGAVMAGSSYPQRWLIVDLASTRESLRQTRVVCKAERPLITLPGPGGIRRYEFMLHDEEADDVATDSAFVHRLLAEHGPDADSPIVRSQVYAFHALIADKWNTPRIYLAGDAAHLSPPFAGQGMNSGLRDAFNLGWKLVAVTQGRLDAGILRTYYEERQPHASDLIQLAINMGRIMMPKSALQERLIQTAFRLTRFSPRTHAYFTQMKYKPKPFYHRGFLNVGDETKLAGRMLPQPLVEIRQGCVVRLDELLGDGFALVAFGVNAQEYLEAANQLDFGLEVSTALAILPSTHNPLPALSSRVQVAREIDGLLASIIPEQATVVLLLRPDRYVAAATFTSLQDLATRTRGLVSDMPTKSWSNHSSKNGGGWASDVA